MKRKWLASILVLVMLCAAAVGGSVMAFALDDSKPEVTVTNINFDSNLLGGYGASTVVGMSAGSGAYWTNLTDNYKTHIEYVDKTGANVLQLVEDCGTSIVLNRTKRDAAVGDIITLKEGLDWQGNEIKATVSYIYNVANNPFLVYAPTDFTAGSATETVMAGANKDISFTAAYADGNYAEAPVTYTSSNPDVAAVTGNGLNANVVGVAEGTATITATLYGGKTATTQVTVEAAKTVTGISVQEGQKVQIYKGATLTNADLASLNAYVNYDGAESSKFTVTADMLSNLPSDFNNLGENTVTLTHQGQSTTFVIEVIDLIPLNLVAVNYDVAWNAYLIDLAIDSGEAGVVSWDTGDLFDIVDSQGQSIKSQLTIARHSNYIFAIHKDEVPSLGARVGTKVVIKQGFKWEHSEAKQQITHIYAEANKSFVVYDSKVHDVTSVTITTEKDDFFFANTTKQLTYTLNSGAAATPSFSTSNAAVATVDANGLITAVAEGKATITVTAGSETATYEVDVKPALPLDRAQLKNSYKIWVEKDGTVALPTDFTAVPVYKNGEQDFEGREFTLVTSGEGANVEITNTVDTSSEGEKTLEFKIAYEGEKYDASVKVEVFSVADMEIKELAVVEWFSFNTFIQYPNSTANNANLNLDFTPTPDSKKVSYVRADGTPVPFGTISLGMGNIAVCPTFDGVTEMNLENFNKDERFYREGDKIILEQGLTGYCWTGTDTGNNNGNAPISGTGMIRRECVLKESVTYMFDGSIWVVFAETKDVTVVSSIDVILGESKNLGARRAPTGATEGSFRYAVADGEIAEINKNGRITAKKIGTTTITVTLTNLSGDDIVKTVTLNVVDGVVELSFGEVEKIDVVKGTEVPDLSKTGAKLVYATGRTEDAVFTDAVIEGYDKDKLGEQIVTVTVTADGVEFSATIIINVVEKKGGCSCGSSVGTYASVAFAALALIAAFAFVAVKKAKQAK